LNGAEFRKDPNFGFDVPVDVHDVDNALLNPRNTWTDKDAYDAQAQKLVQMFAENFGQYMDYVDDDVKAVVIG
jgi:phosphoenolpyruvate carboxykinase (ATP)